MNLVFLKKLREDESLSIDIKNSFTSKKSLRSNVQL